MVSIQYEDVKYLSIQVIGTTLNPDLGPILTPLAPATMRIPVGLCTPTMTRRTRMRGTDLETNTTTARIARRRGKRRGK